MPALRIHRDILPPMIGAHRRSAHVWTAARIPPAVLGIGILLWRMTLLLARRDLFVPLRQENVYIATFAFVARQGWWIVFLFSLLWSIAASRAEKPTKRVQAQAIAAASFIAVLFAALIVLPSSQPWKPFKMWSSGNAGCTGTVDSSVLRKFADRYQMAMICVIVDPSTDKLTSTQIAKTGLFDISDGELFAPYMGDVAVRIATSAPEIYRALVLLPKSVEMDEITSLADVKKHGGKIFSNEGPI